MMCPVLRGLCVAAVALLSAPCAWAQPMPTVIELFTSQGCSSCPPADALLGELSADPEVVALAFHVDYWNSLGWTDGFALADSTRRQRSYARALGLSSPYTPQMVVNGTRDAVGSDRTAVLAALAGGRHDGVPIQMTVDETGVQVGLDAALKSGLFDIVAITYRLRAETLVRRGENAGRSLPEFNIVRSIQVLGTWSGGSAHFSVSKDQIPTDADRIAVLVQRPGQAAILGAVVAALR